MKHIPIEQVNVYLSQPETPLLVGRLASNNHQIYFEYDQTFLNQAFDLSPFHLPLKPGAQLFDNNLFDGLPGVFDDSLPDGWGRLLLDRAVRAQGILAGELSPLDRLSHVGNEGMGALSYEPSQQPSASDENQLDLDTLANEIKLILQGEATDVINELLSLNGSSAGARPKAMIGLHKNKKEILHGSYHFPSNYEPWLVKFSNSSEPTDSGAVEFVYAQMAKLAGIEMMETYLLPAKQGPGYFATKRFDRTADGERLHVHSACGLLHSNFRTPCLDYQDLMKATLLLTKDRTEVIKVFRLAVFNVLAHNRDDHSKNFSFLMDPKGKWSFAPAYDLTFSSGPGGEQSTMVMGVGRDIGISHLKQLGAAGGIDKLGINSIIEQVSEAVNQFTTLAKHAGVSDLTISLVEKQNG